MQKIVLAMSLTMLALSIQPSPCPAQNKIIPTFPPGKYKARPERREVKSKEIIIPDLPRYPAARFISGTDSSHTKFGAGGTSYSITYSVPKSNELQVIPYYAGILSSGDWKVVQETDRVINARNKNSGGHCSIGVSSFDQINSTIQVEYAIPAGQ